MSGLCPIRNPPARPRKRGAMPFLPLTPDPAAFQIIAGKRSGGPGSVLLLPAEARGLSVRRNAGHGSGNRRRLLQREGLVSVPGSLLSTVVLRTVMTSGPFHGKTPVWVDAGMAPARTRPVGGNGGIGSSGFWGGSVSRPAEPHARRGRATWDMRHPRPLRAMPLFARHVVFGRVVSGDLARFPAHRADMDKIPPSESPP